MMKKWFCFAKDKRDYNVIKRRKRKKTVTLNTEHKNHTFKDPN